MKQLVAFLIIVAWCFGVIGGVGTTIYCGMWPSAVGMIVVAWLTLPKLQIYFDELVSYHGKK